MSDIKASSASLRTKEFIKDYSGLIIGIVIVVISLIIISIIVFFYISDILRVLSLANEFLKDWSGLILGVTGTVISLIVFF